MAYLHTMPGQTRQSPLEQYMHPNQHAPMDQFLGLAELQAQHGIHSIDVSDYGDSDKELVLRQAPLYARVAMGKEKGKSSHSIEMFETALTQ